MCRKREYDDRDRLVCPWPMVELIDLTVDEFAEDEFDGFIDVNILPMNENWNYPYNLLPSNDEEEPLRGLASYVEENGDPHNTVPNAENLTNEINQNTDTLNAETNIAETNETDQSVEVREFELNIPQILLSMSRISNNLFERAATPQD